jgi:hypothetical protein
MAMLRSSFARPGGVGPAGAAGFYLVASAVLPGRDMYAAASHMIARWPTGLVSVL